MANGQKSVTSRLKKYKLYMSFILCLLFLQFLGSPSNTKKLRGLIGIEHPHIKEIQNFCSKICATRCGTKGNQLDPKKWLACRQASHPLEIKSYDNRRNPIRDTRIARCHAHWEPSLRLAHPNAWHVRWQAPWSSKKWRRLPPNTCADRRRILLDQHPWKTESLDVIPQPH